MKPTRKSYIIPLLLTLLSISSKLYAGSWTQDTAGDWATGSGSNIDTTTYIGSAALTLNNYTVQSASVALPATQFNTLGNAQFRQSFYLKSQSLINTAHIYTMYDNGYSFSVVFSSSDGSTIATPSKAWNGQYSGAYTLTFPSGLVLDANTTYFLTVTNGGAVTYSAFYSYTSDPFPAGKLQMYYTGSWQDVTLGYSYIDFRFDIQTTSPTTGSFTAQPFFATNWGPWGTFSANDIQPVGSSIAYYAVTSTSVANLKTNTSFSLANGGAINSTVGPYIQIISSFARTGASVVPMIDSFTVTWDDCYKISGHVFYPDGHTPFPSATVKIDCVVSSRTCLSDANGYYELYGSIGKNWTLSASSSPSNGSAIFPSIPPYNNLQAEVKRDILRDLGSPVLDWTHISPYNSDGIYPTVGVSSFTYNFQIVYSDNENDAVSGSPKVNIKRNGVVVQQLGMNAIAGSNWVSPGITYSTSTLLSASTSYSYSFEAQNIWGATATGDPTIGKNEPTVNATISGRLSTYFGAAVPNINVTLYHNSANAGNVTTNSNGAFAFYGLTQGDIYTIIPASSSSCYFDIYSANYAPLLGDATQQFTRMDNVVSISGSVKNPDGSALAGINVSLSGAHSATTVSDPNGNYQLYVTTEVFGMAANYANYLFTPSSYTLSNTTSLMSNVSFVRLNRPPVLSVTNETGYTSSAVEPNSAKPNDTLNFRIKYSDADCDVVKSGYPIVYVLLSGTKVQSLPMKFDSGSSELTGKVYTISTSLNLAGNYTYFIQAQDIFNGCAQDYSGTFTVQTDAPPAPVINSNGVKNGATVVSGKVTLDWAEDSSPGMQITYHLYLSDAQNSEGTSVRRSPPPESELRLVYTGSEPSYTLTSLEANKTYYWQAEAVNQYAVSTKSVMYSFNTIQNTPRAFNYPNPFNPATGQITHIVFNMRQSGNAEVTVYSELGDRIWRQSFSGLNEGTNEVSYNGYDGNGRQLYNGTYVCIIMKNYDSGGGDKDSCRLMIIK